MGVFEKIFGGKKIKQNEKVNGYFQMLDGYTPIFTSFDGGVYEMELTRACIHTFAQHCSKLQPTVEGADLVRLQRILDTKPNEFMTSAQFLYKVATIYEIKNTCFIVPILDKFDRIQGFYPINPQQAELIDVNGEPYLRFSFSNGKRASMELSRVGVLSKYLYKNDIFGETNNALRNTLNLINMQNQGIKEGIKNSASFRFMANVNNFAKAEDLAKERKRFVEENLGSDAGGLALFPNTFSNVQQINSTPNIVNPEQMQIIQDRVYQYFNTNADILMNKTTTGDAWASYYEGKIEPFAIQLSQAMTSMCYTENQLARGNAICWTANRLQYMTNADKLNVSSAMFDRGIMTINQIMDMWQLPHTEDGDKRYIRKEYIDMSQLEEANKTDNNEVDINDSEEQEEPSLGYADKSNADDDIAEQSKE